MRREHTQKRISRLISHERCKQKKIALHCFAAFHMEVSSCIINSIDEIRQESLSCKKEINFYFHISDSNFFFSFKPHRGVLFCWTTRHTLCRSKSLGWWDLKSDFIHREGFIIENLLARILLLFLVHLLWTINFVIKRDRM